jgi:hypothetical protein
VLSPEKVAAHCAHSIMQKKFGHHFFQPFHHIIALRHVFRRTDADAIVFELLRGYSLK